MLVDREACHRLKQLLAETTGVFKRVGTGDTMTSVPLEMAKCKHRGRDDEEPKSSDLASDADEAVIEASDADEAVMEAVKSYGVSHCKSLGECNKII